LSKSTVSERLKELVQEKLVVADPYSEIVLTKKGIAVGAKLTFKHRTIEVFLNTVLKMPTHLVHAEAHKLEHAVSDDVIQRLSKFLNNPTEDPHGSTIPTITDWR
jgi:DtxR family Mn-dependent transcriptional regulator